MPLSTPIALVIFQRSEHTRKVFAEIRKIQPKELFVIADGPRSVEESHLCQQARKITDEIDWDCEVRRNYSDINLGCRQRISSGLDWVFKHVDEVIVLEDDCLPHPSFFRYCQELLTKYQFDSRVWCISGNNFQSGQRRGEGSYYFSNYNHCWGWATWKRAWSQYDHHLSQWPEFRDGSYLSEILDTEDEILYWYQIFEKLYNIGKPNSWAYAWTFTCWKNRGLTILPNINLVSNIGFGENATHTKGDSPSAHLPVYEIGELQHPKFISRDWKADIYTFDHHFGGIFNRRIDLKLKKKLKRMYEKLRTKYYNGF